MCNKTEVAVGLSISLTGKFRPLGQQALQGIRLWQSYINAQGGIAVRNGEKRSVRLIGMTITVRSALPGRTYSGFFETIGLTFS